MSKLTFLQIFFTTVLITSCGLMSSCNNNPENVVAAELSVSDDDVDFLAVGNDPFEINVTGPADWRVKISTEARSWLTASKEGGKLIVTALDNPTESERTGTLTLASSVEGAGNPTIEVKQDAWVDQAFYSTVSLSRATYFGDEFGEGTGSFTIVLYDDNNPVNYLYLCGNGPISDTPDRFVLTDGLYEADGGNHGTEMSFVEGYLDSSTKWSGSLISIREKDGDTETAVGVILITGGEFSIAARAGGGYVIKTRLTGVNIDTNEVVEDINFKYDGPITFRNQEFTIYKETCTKVVVQHKGNEYGAGDVTSGQYLVNMYTGYVDSNGSMVPPYKCLEIELYGLNWDKMENFRGTLPPGEYICTGGKEFWTNYRIMPSTLDLGTGTYTRSIFLSYSADNPSSPETAVGVMGGSLRVEKTGEIYNLAIGFNAAHIIPESMLNKPAKIFLNYEGAIEFPGY